MLKVELERKVSLSPTQARGLIEKRLRLPLSKSTLYRMIQAGRITAQRVGIRWWIPLEAINQFITACQAGERV